MRKIKIIILLCCISLQQLLAQTAEEKIELAKSLNMPLLEKIKREAELKQELFVKYKKIYNWAETKKAEDGTIGTLTDFDEKTMEPIYSYPLDLGGFNTINAGPIQSDGNLGLNYEGQGMLAGIWELPSYNPTTNIHRRYPIETHQDFMVNAYQTRLGRAYNIVPTLETNPGVTYTQYTQGHATFVSAMLIAKDNIAQPTPVAVRGIARKASAVVFSYPNSSISQTSQVIGMLNPSIGGLLNMNLGMLVSNDSHTGGDDLNNLLYGAPKYTRVYANGNHSLNSKSADCKNCLSVGGWLRDVLPGTPPEDINFASMRLENLGLNIPIGNNILASSTITVNSSWWDSYNQQTNTWTYRKIDNDQIEVKLGITHPNIGNLKIYLVGPNNCGTIELSTNNGAGSANLSNVILSTAATNGIQLASVPFNSIYYKTEGAINTPPATLTGIYATLPTTSLVGCKWTGNWTLKVGDDVNNNVGTLNYFRLSFYHNLWPTPYSRVKPEVSAKFLNLTAPDAGNGAIGGPTNSYGYNVSGTSFSAPAVAGGVLLLQQVFKDYNPQFMNSATVKALMVHTATEAGYPGPDLGSGYGIVNLSKAAKVIINNNLTTKILENSLSPNTTYTTTVIAGSVAPLEVTLAWTDPVNSAQSSSLLINDLDLRVTSANGTELPWALNATNPIGQSLKIDNTADNLEKIQILNPIPGQTYTITVSHKGTNLYNSLPQAYSLIISGYNNCATTSQTSLNIIAPVNAYLVDNKHANQNITATNVINALANARYVAGQEVLLQTNFDALATSNFDALLGDCIATSMQRVGSTYNPVHRDMILFDVPNEKEKAIATEIKTEPIIYPNPNNGKFTIKPNGIGIGSFEILNSAGSLIHNGSINNEAEIPINISGVNSGIYYIIINCEKGIFTKKITIT